MMASDVTILTLKHDYKEKDIPIKKQGLKIQKCNHRR